MNLRRINLAISTSLAVISTFFQCKIIKLINLTKRCIRNAFSYRWIIKLIFCTSWLNWNTFILSLRIYLVVCTCCVDVYASILFFRIYLGFQTNTLTFQSLIIISSIPSTCLTFIYCFVIKRCFLWTWNTRTNVCKINMLTFGTLRTFILWSIEIWIIIRTRYTRSSSNRVNDCFKWTRLAYYFLLII